MRIRTILFFLLTTSASAAWAHGQGVHTHEAGLLAGFMHPFSGLDHLLAMFAVGLWAAQRGGKATWVLPASFVGMMAVGGLLAVKGMQLVGMESMIALSVLMLGLLVAMRSSLSLMAAVLMTGLLALFHGVAHGQEMPLAASPWVYAVGMLASTALLHGMGVISGMKLRQLYLTMTGAAISIAGFGMLLGLAG